MCACSSTSINVVILELAAIKLQRYYRARHTDDKHWSEAHRTQKRVRMALAHVNELKLSEHRHEQLLDAWQTLREGCQVYEAHYHPRGHLAAPTGGFGDPRAKRWLWVDEPTPGGGGRLFLAEVRNDDGDGDGAAQKDLVVSSRHHSNVTAVCRRLDLAEARREPDAARHLKSLAIRDIHELRLGCLSHGFALCERRHLPSEAQRASCLSVVGTEV